MRFTTLLTLVTIGTALSSAALAEDLFVPSPEHPTIQAALDSAMDGDTIVLRAGTLTGPGNWNLVMPAIRLTFRGETGDARDVRWRGSFDPATDIARAMSIESAASSGTRFEDLTIEGFRSQGGGAFRVRGVDLAFEGCIIEDNRGAAVDCFEGERGGAFEVIGGSVRFIDCLISRNGTTSIVCDDVGAACSGGAIEAIDATLFFERCRIEGNAASPGDGASPGAGGAISSTGHVEMIDTVVNGNTVSGSVARGGAISAGTVLAIGCRFQNNRAPSLNGTAIGGAIHAGRATIINSTFTTNRVGSENTSFAAGGAIDADELTMVNVLAVTNIARATIGVEGGGVRTTTGHFTNTTLLDNRIISAPEGSGLAIYSDGGTITIRNSIIDNGPGWFDGSSDVTAVWSCIVGGFPGEGNIDADPMLDRAFVPMPGSPVIDAANTTLLPPDEFDLDGDGDTSEAISRDVDGRVRVLDDPDSADSGVGSPVVDMGSSEVVPPCAVDLDRDGAPTILDFLAFQNLFAAGDLRADFDGDGSLTLFDFLAFQNAFDAGCP